MASDEIERFRREIVQRTGDAHAAENLSDQDLLREAMNTVGKPGQLGGSIRCVVSVSMLTEGWDANTVTHEERDGYRRSLTADERLHPSSIGGRIFRDDNMTSQRPPGDFPV